MLLILLAALAASAQQPKAISVSEYPSALIREEQNIVVDGVTETWRLQWKTKPEAYCEPSDTSLTCPCMGFAYGEIGDLYLMRLRNGSEIDRLHLTPLFKEEPGAAVQRWVPDHDHDFEASEREDFAELVQQRPTAQVMHFHDYDHDGAATEFYLQAEADPCGKSAGVLIGISKSNPRLHVFGSVSHPGKPLYLFVWEWDALRDSTVPAKVTDWPCRDHGADTETELVLHWSGDTVDGVRREYTCPLKDEKPALIKEEPL